MAFVYFFKFRKNQQKSYLELYQLWCDGEGKDHVDKYSL